MAASLLPYIHRSMRGRRSLPSRRIDALGSANLFFREPFTRISSLRGPAQTRSPFDCGQHRRGRRSHESRRSTPALRNRTRLRHGARRFSMPARQLAPQGAAPCRMDGLYCFASSQCSRRCAADRPRPRPRPRKLGYAPPKKGPSETRVLAKGGKKKKRSEELPHGNAHPAYVLIQDLCQIVDLTDNALQTP